MTRKTYKTRECEVGKVGELVARGSCEQMLNIECEMAKKSGVVEDSDGLLSISVSYDMGESKRGRAHNSLTGHGAVMGTLTGKVLDLTTRNKLCRTCQSAKEFGCDSSPYDCRLNHTSSSKSMEPESAVELFSKPPVLGETPAKYSILLEMMIVLPFQEFGKK